MANLFFYLFCVFALLTATEFKADKQLLDTHTVNVFELTDLDSVLIESENESEDLDTLVRVDSAVAWISAVEPLFVESELSLQPVLINFSPIRAPPQHV